MADFSRAGGGVQWDPDACPDGRPSHVVPQGLAFTRGRLRRSLATAGIQMVSWRLRERFGRKVVPMTVETGGKILTCTYTFQNGADLATELTPLVSPS